MVLTLGIKGIHLDITAQRPAHGPTAAADGSLLIDAEDAFVDYCNKLIYVDCEERSPDGRSFTFRSDGWTRLKHFLPLSRRATIDGQQFVIPYQAEEVLRLRYGDEWRVPDRAGKGRWVHPEDVHSVTSSTFKDHCRNPMFSFLGDGTGGTIGVMKSDAAAAGEEEEFYFPNAIEAMKDYDRLLSLEEAERRRNV